MTTNTNGEDHVTETTKSEDIVRSGIGPAGWTENKDGIMVKSSRPIVRVLLPRNKRLFEVSAPYSDEDEDSPLLEIKSPAALVALVDALVAHCPAYAEAYEKWRAERAAKKQQGSEAAKESTSSAARDAEAGR